MYSLFAEPFQNDFMWMALRVSLVLAVLCAALGVLLVPRGLSMLGDGLSHATFGGVGIGLLSGLSVDQAMWAAMPFAIGVSLAIVFLGRHGRIAKDAALGVFFAVSLAVGIAALHIAARRGGGADLEAVLFGNILGVQPIEVHAIELIAALVLVTLLFQGPRIAYSGFYPELAAMNGVRVQLQEYILMTLTAVVTVVAVKAVGVLLVSAWLVIPSTIGQHLMRRQGPILFSAMLVAIVGSFAGLLTSYYYDIPSGAAMTLTLGVLFAASFMLRRVCVGLADESRK